MQDISIDIYGQVVYDGEVQQGNTKKIFLLTFIDRLLDGHELSDLEISHHWNIKTPRIKIVHPTKKFKRWKNCVPATNSWLEPIQGSWWVDCLAKNSQCAGSFKKKMHCSHKNYTTEQRGVLDFAMLDGRVG